MKGNGIENDRLKTASRKEKNMSQSHGEQANQKTEQKKKMPIEESVM